MKHELPKRILAPVAMLEGCAISLKYAGVIAKTLEAELHVVHAHLWDAPVEFMMSQTDLLLSEHSAWESASQAEVEAFARKHVGDVLTDAVVLEMDVVDAIVARAERVDADLLVLCTHGRSGVERMIYGSVAEEVLRRENRPGLIIRHEAAQTPSADSLFKRILCPVNLTEVARDTLEVACAWACRLNSQLTVLYAVEEGAHETEESVRGKVCAWVPEAGSLACEFELEVRKGNAAEQVVQHASDDGADLIVIGAQKQPFLETTLFGTTTERVMRHAPCPVMVVPRN